MEQRFGYSLDELARRFDRSVSWVSRRLALVEALPEAIQRQVREGKISAQVALKFLVPAVRISLEAYQRMAAIFAKYHCETREAGQLYAAWRKASPAIRQRILDAPDLFFKTQRQAQEKTPAGTGAELLRDLEMMSAIMNRAQRRLTGATVMDLDTQQSWTARDQIERIQKQLRRLGETIPPKKDPHVDPSPTHDDSARADSDIQGPAVRLALDLVERAIIGGGQRARGAVGCYAGRARLAVDVTRTLRPGRSRWCRDGQDGAYQRQRRRE